MANTIVKATPPTKTDHATLLFTLADKGVIQLTKRPANASFAKSKKNFPSVSRLILFSLRKAKINILFVITDIMPDFILSPSSGS